MWVCVKATLTPVGWVQPGRVAAEGDPMLDRMNPEAWERLTVDGSVVEEATAEPGRQRRTGRRRGV